MVGVRSPSSQGDAKKIDGSDATSTSKSDRTDDKGGGGCGRLAEDQDRLSNPEKSSKCQTAERSTKRLVLWRSTILILSISSILFCAYLALRQVQTDQEIQLLKAELRQLQVQQQQEQLPQRHQQQPTQESSSWRIKRDARVSDDANEPDCKCVGLPGQPGPPMGVPGGGVGGVSLPDFAPNIAGYRPIE